jgi:hypothetical protein
LALFTDSDVVTVADLSAIDAEIVAAAASAAPGSPIVLSGDGSIIRQAWSEVGVMILEDQQLYNTYYGYQSTPGGAAYAVSIVGTAGRSQARLRLNQIVVDFSYGNVISAMKQWIAYYALYLFYRDASVRKSVKKEDRLSDKRDMFEIMAKKRRSNIRNIGIPFVAQMMECPGALHAFNPGTWGAANLSNVTLGSATQQIVFVAITYIDRSLYGGPGILNLNGESGPSAKLQFTITANSVLGVSIASLIPPNGVDDPVGTADGLWVPLNATGWNVYVGASATVMYLQNATPIPIATKTYQLAAAPVLSGTLLGTGQFSNLNLVFARTINRM